MDPQGQELREAISGSISERIEAARRSSGATREDVATAARAAGAPASFTAAAYRNIEQARRGVGVDELLWLATALGATVRELLGDHAHLFGADVATPPACGELEDETRRAIEDLGDLDGVNAPLARLATHLAKTLDDGVGMATAAVSKELRATLGQLWEGQDEDEDEDEEGYGPA